MRRLTICVAVSICGLVLHGCASGRVEMSASTQQSLASQKKLMAGDSANCPSSANSSANQSAGCAEPNRQRCLDYAAETEISNESLRAWRLELSGKTDDAMAALEALDKKYPNIKTVYLMKGQVQQHAGHKEEALKYYKQSIVGNEFDSTELFKTAELEREMGKTEQAVTHYRRLLEASPMFTAGRLGLAKALLKQDLHSAEAKNSLQKIVDEDKDGKDKMAQEAASLLAALETPAMPKVTQSKAQTKIQTKALTKK
ncbi:MAG TPA: tetratricopeptide repeat protein [Oculatellaceae cyanobacterium]